MAANRSGEMAEGEAGLLTAEQQAELLRIARQSIAARVTMAPRPLMRVKDPELRRKSGAFVTIKWGKELRGCVGVVEPRMTLADAVAHAAAAAACEDYRFEPLAEHELPEVRLEVSVLSPLEPVPDPAQVEVGKHGLMVVDGPNRGLLLPQVPVEWGWDREQFLEHTCLKAGLARDAWKKGAQLYWFSAQVFGEGEGNLHLNGLHHGEVKEGQ